MSWAKNINTTIDIYEIYLKTNMIVFQAQLLQLRCPNYPEVFQA